MVTIIHGQDTSASREHLLSLMQDTKQFPIVEGTKLALTALVQSFEGGGLFSQEKKLLVENFFSDRKPGTEFDKIIEYAVSSEHKGHVIFWERKELTRKQLSLVKNASVHIFQYPQVLFSFLDSITPGNGTNAIALFHQVLASKEVELVFFMLIRQVRMLLTQDAKHSAIEEIARLAPWQKAKLTRQSELFGQAVLARMYEQLFAIERGTKTGTLPTPLVPAVDFFLLGL